MTGGSQQGVTNPSQALQQLQTQQGPGMQTGQMGMPQGIGSTGFVPSQQSNQAFLSPQQQPGQFAGFQGQMGQQAGGAMVPQQQGAQAFQQMSQANPALNANGSSSSMPQWQKGLMGAMTGDKQYGANAPAIHQALNSSMQMMQQGQGQQSQSPQMMMARRQMGSTGTTLNPMASTAPNSATAGSSTANSLAPWMRRYAMS